MQNFSVTMGIVLGIVTVAIWLGGAVWFLSDLHSEWEAHTKKVADIETRLSDIDGHLQESKASNQWLKEALCKHYEGSKKESKAKKTIDGCKQG